MITDGLASSLSDVFAWLISPLNNWTLDPWVTQANTQLQTVLLYLGGLGVWADWTLIGRVMATVISVFLICFAVKVGFWIFSHIPVIGGAA